MSITDSTPLYELTVKTDGGRRKRPRRIAFFLSGMSFGSRRGAGAAAMRDVNPLDLVETMRKGILVLDPDLTIRFANRSFYDTFAVAPEHTVERKLYEIGGGQWDIPKLRSSLKTVISGRTTIEDFEVERPSRTLRSNDHRGL